MAKIHLFVYGTLKRGCRNHALLKGQEFVRAAVTEPRYRLYHCGRYPGLVPDPDGVAVHGELWRVDESLLPRLDRYEGVPTLFRRETVVVEGLDGPVLVYLFNGDVAALPDCGSKWPRESRRAPRKAD